MIKEKNMKNIRQEFKEKGIFYTSSELAETLKKYVPFKPKKVYDPTCGAGNLLAVFDDDIEKYGQELYEDQLNIAAERLKNFHGYAGDTLIDDGFKDEKFDCIVGNPPFSIKWEQNPNDERFNKAGVLPPPSKADYAFLLHILHHLSDDGIAVVLNFPGILYRGNKAGKVREWFVRNNYIEKVIAIPKDKFVDTNISTCILVLRKNKETTDIFFEDTETGATHAATFEEIEKNNFNLSVHTYAYIEEEKEKIDIQTLNAELRECDVKHIIANLEYDYQICKLEGDMLAHRNFVKTVKRAVEEYEKRLEEEENNNEMS